MWSASPKPLPLTLNPSIPQHSAVFNPGCWFAAIGDWLFWGGAAGSGISRSAGRVHEGRLGQGAIGADRDRGWAGSTRSWAGGTRSVAAAGPELPRRAEDVAGEDVAVHPQIGQLEIGAVGTADLVAPPKLAGTGGGIELEVLPGYREAAPQRPAHQIPLGIEAPVAFGLRAVPYKGVGAAEL